MQHHAQILHERVGAAPFLRGNTQPDQAADNGGKDRGAAVFQTYRGVDLPRSLQAYEQRAHDVPQLVRTGGHGLAPSRRAQRLGNHLIIAHPVGGNVLQIGYRPLLQPGQRAAVGKQDADAFVFPGKAVFGQALQDLLL